MGISSLRNSSALNTAAINFLRNRNCLTSGNVQGHTEATPVSHNLCTRSLETETQRKWHRKVAVTEKSTKKRGQFIKLEMSVIDTHPGETDRPTVVAIHGSPGSGMDFEPLISHLAEKGVRFIAPTTPGFEPSSVEPWKLLHLDYSTKGRALLVEKVLKEVSVDRIDLLMSHSAGTWAGYKMAAEWECVKSACFLNPCGARPHKSLRPFASVKTLAWILQQRSLHYILMPLMERVYQNIGFTGIKGGDHIVAAQKIVTSQGFEDMPKYAYKIRERKLPLVFAFTLNDRIVETPVSKEMFLHHLGVPELNLTTFSADQTPSGNSFCATEDGWVARGLLFERGGHVVHKAYSKIILEHVADLLAHAQKS